MNSVNIIGRLVKDPDIKKTDAGLSICDLRLAVDDMRSKDDRADFINVTVFGGQADLCKRYLRKGFMTGISGRIRTDVYTDSAGVKRYPIKLIAENLHFLQWPDNGKTGSDKIDEIDEINEIDDFEEIKAEDAEAV